MIGYRNHTILSNDCKRLQTKVKYFCIGISNKKVLCPSPIQSPTIDSKFKYNDLTLIGIMYKNTVDTKYHDKAMPYMYYTHALPNMRT